MRSVMRTTTPCPSCSPRSLALLGANIEAVVARRQMSDARGAMCWEVHAGGSGLCQFARCGGACAGLMPIGGTFHIPPRAFQCAGAASCTALTRQHVVRQRSTPRVGRDAFPRTGRGGGLVRARTEAFYHRALRAFAKLGLPPQRLRGRGDIPQSGDPKDGRRCDGAGAFAGQ